MTGKWSLTPAGVPQDRAKVLRQAFQKLYTDPEFVKEWERIFGLKLDFIPGEGADKIMSSLLEPSPGWDFIKNEYMPKLKASQQ